jgi:hypothetical protein
MDPVLLMFVCERRLMDPVLLMFVCERRLMDPVLDVCVREPSHLLMFV